ncbi:hypothetical protein GGU11DRAFT_655999, partial [Lentinula aff. detonsa]
AKLVPALGAVHNFIRVKDPADYARGIQNKPAELHIIQAMEDEDMGEEAEDGELGGRVSPAERRRALAKRDAIAKAMWDDYVKYI